METEALRSVSARWNPGSARQARRDLAQGTFEHLDRLSTGHQVLAFDDHCRHAVDAVAGEEPFGLAHLCRGLDIMEQGCFGRMDETWDWWGRAAGAGQLQPAVYARVRAAMSTLDDWMTADRLQKVAPAVCLLGRKR